MHYHLGLVAFQFYVIHYRYLAYLHGYYIGDGLAVDARARTGPDGRLRDCVDPETGLRRPLRRYSRPAVYRLGLGRRMGRGRGRRGRW